jgi:RHS repeat-associated protein
MAGNDNIEFATYLRDSYTGLDYANQRFYASTYGRFNTADPYKASAGPSDPGTWNRYSYTAGDPVNRRDPSGLLLVGSGGYGSYEACMANGVGGGEVCPLNDDDDGASVALACQDPLRPNPNCYTIPEQNAAPPTPTCEQVETAYVYAYLSKYKSPLAAYASLIVTYSDTFGIDDRFIVALAGAESQYGKTQQTSPTWGFYNAFSNGSHCQALSATSDCYKVNPYIGHGAAISDVIGLITGAKYFGSGLVTVEGVYDTYNRVPSSDFLTTIYDQLVPGATNNTKVNFSRCP